MAQFPVKFSVRASTGSLVKRLTNLFKKEMPKELNAARGRIQNRIENEVGEVLRGSEIYDALVHGDLKAHFGFERGSAFDRVEDIINAIVESLEVNVKSGFLGVKFTGAIEVVLLRDRFLQLLNLPAAKVVDRERGYELPWLKWLLTQGTRILVIGHEIQFGNYANNRRSRSGEAIMVERVKSAPRSGNNWSIPPEYAGTESNNWLTSTLADQAFIDILHAIVVEELEKQFS